jgi:hypothetical protein
MPTTNAILCFAPAHVPDPATGARMRAVKAPPRIHKGPVPKLGSKEEDSENSVIEP